MHLPCFSVRPLEDKPNDFGKQRCWTSIGWGSVTMLSGWLVDYFSYDKVQKDYTPISYLIILSFMILNLFVASNIPVRYTFARYCCKSTLTVGNLLLFEYAYYTWSSSNCHRTRSKTFLNCSENFTL